MPKVAKSCHKLPTVDKICPGVNKKLFVCNFHERRFQNPDEGLDGQFHNCLLVTDSFGTIGMFLLTQASSTEHMWKMCTEVLTHDTLFPSLN